MEWQKKLEEEDTIIVRWAQEDVETLYNLLNNNISSVWYLIYDVLSFFILPSCFSPEM